MGAMKFSEKDFKFLEEQIKPLDTEERRRRYSEGQFVNPYAVKDLTKRYCWDLFFAAQVLYRQGGGEFYAELWDEDYNDSHIETAVRKIVSVEIPKEYK